MKAYWDEPPVQVCERMRYQLVARVQVHVKKTTSEECTSRPNEIDHQRIASHAAWNQREQECSAYVTRVDAGVHVSHQDGPLGRTRHGF